MELSSGLNYNPPGWTRGRVTPRSNEPLASVGGDLHHPRSPQVQPGSSQALIPNNVPSLASNRKDLGFLKLAALLDELKVLIFSHLYLDELAPFLKALDFAPQLAHKPSGKTLRTLGYKAIASYSKPLGWSKYDIFSYLPAKWILRSYPYCRFQSLKHITIDAPDLSEFKEHYYENFSAVSHLSLYVSHLAARDAEENADLIKTVTTIPQWPEPEKIRILRLDGYKQLSSLDGIEAFKQLQTLILGNSEGLKDISALKDIRALKHLILKLNWDLPTFSGLKGFEALSQLQSLKIILFNGFRSLDGIEALKNLEILVLRGSTPNSIEAIASLAALKNLRSLGLNCTNGLNNLTELEALSGLESLIELDLNHCHILSCLKPIAHLKQLERLDLDNCRQVLDFSVLKELPRLKWLSVRGCRWTDPQLLEDLMARGVTIRGLESLDFTLYFNPAYKPRRVKDS